MQLRGGACGSVAGLRSFKFLGEPDQRFDDMGPDVLGRFEKRSNACFADAGLQSLELGRARPGLNILYDNRMIFVNEEDEP
jgi:hypothetical protein